MREQMKVVMMRATNEQEYMVMMAILVVEEE